MTTEENPSPSSPIIVNEKNLSAIRRDSVQNDLSTADICKLFNEFLIEFEQMEQSGVTTTEMFLNAVEQIADAVVAIRPYKLLDPKLLLHPLMTFLHQMLVDILDNWQATDSRLNIQETDIFLKITLIFVHAAEQAPAHSVEEDRKRVRDLVATKKFISLVREQIEDTTINQNGMNDDPNICTLGLLTFKLLEGCPFYYSAPQNDRLINDLVMNCIDSYDYIQSLYRLQHGEDLTDCDRLLLFTCWEFIPFVTITTAKLPRTADPLHLIQKFYEEILTRLEKALNEPQLVVPSSFAYIFERCNQLLNTQNLPNFDKHANLIIDYLTNILQKPSSTNPDDEALVGIALEAFRNLTKNTDIRAMMKKRQLTSVFNKYTSADMGDKRKLAFGILAEIMDEQEINNNPTEMTGIFIEQLKQLNLNEYNPDVDSTLSTLQGLMQHDQVKAEFIKQGGIDKLIAFVRDGVPNKQSDVQLEDTLKILLSCTFNNPEVLDTLKQDEKLMTRVNQVYSKAVTDENSALEKAAEGLIWKVEKEEKFKQAQEAEADRKKKEKKQKAKESGVEEEEEEEESEQYDLMISYSWADMDLAHRIFKHLTEKLGYKIWLDQEQMSGSTIGAMANAVESAQFILMCMSDTYKRSANCQSEAEYAFSRKKHIVPIKMKKDYVPDGWLGFILGTRLYIDFGTYDFDKAIGLLDTEIQLQKKKRKDAKAVARAERQAAAQSEDTEDIKEGKEEVLTSKKGGGGSNISHWNEGNVRDFLMKQNLPSMLTLCDGINGEELSTLYTMCKTNPASMYRSLKFELLHGHNRILPISTFLRFISRMRAVCDDGSPSNTQTMIKNHEEHLSNDE